VRGVARICHTVTQPTAGPGDVNHAFFDLFSLVHMSAGAAFGALGLGFFPMLVLAMGWEIAEHVMKDCIPHVFVHPSQDTLLNACGDVLVTMVGWTLGRFARVRTLRSRAQRRGARSGLPGVASPRSWPRSTTGVPPTST
jgi:hypothetical protein